MSRIYQVDSFHVIGTVRRYDLGGDIRFNICCPGYHYDPKTFDPNRVWWGAVNSEQLIEYLRNFKSMEDKLEWKKWKENDIVYFDYFILKEAHIEWVIDILEKAINEG